MKKIVAIIPLVSLLALALIGCQLSEPSSEEQIDAETIAWLVTDPGYGLTQEVADLGTYLFGLEETAAAEGEVPTVQSKALGITASYALYCCGDLGGFTWNPDTQAYEKELYDVEVLLPYREIYLDRLFVQVRFYTSEDGSGEPYQPLQISAGLDPAVGSLTYYREADGLATNLVTGTESDFQGVTDLLYSHIDAENNAVTISGSHDRTFERLFVNGRMASGEAHYTIRDLDVAYDEETQTFAYSGEIDYIYDATVTRANGTVVTRHREATISFDGTTTFVVVVGGIRFRFHLLTGLLVN